MRLGLWNRLAVVATVLALLIAPTTAMVRENIAMEKFEEQQFYACKKVANSLIRLDHQAYRKADQQCWDQRFNNPYRWRAGWSFWREAALATAVICVILYVLIWAAAATARWVWRGRLPNKNTETA